MALFLPPFLFFLVLSQTLLVAPKHFSPLFRVAINFPCRRIDSSGRPLFVPPTVQSADLFSRPLRDRAKVKQWPQSLHSAYRWIIISDVILRCRVIGYLTARVADRSCTFRERVGDDTCAPLGMHNLEADHVRETFNIDSSMQTGKKYLGSRAQRGTENPRYPNIRPVKHPDVQTSRSN